MTKDRTVLTKVEQILLEKLEEFAKANQTGMISIDVQVSNGKPTAINTATRENLKI